MDGAECTAQQVYEWTRDKSGYTIPMPYMRRVENQSAFVYTFEDGSQFIQYKGDFACKAYRNPEGYMMAKRGFAKQHKAKDSVNKEKVWNGQM